MKKLLNYIVTVLLIASSTSCDPDFLNLTDPDSFDVPKYYQTEEDMNDALTAVYQATRGFYDQMFFVTEMKSDNAAPIPVYSPDSLPLLRVRCMQSMPIGPIGADTNMPTARP